MNDAWNDVENIVERGMVIVIIVCGLCMWMRTYFDRDAREDVCLMIDCDGGEPELA